MTIPTVLLSLMTAVVSAHALSIGLAAAGKPHKYEDRAKKAAEWSSAAERRLWDTRYTIGSGVVASVVFLLSALNLLLRLVGPSRGGGGAWFPYHALWAALVAASQRHASRYMLSFWGGKAMIPLLDDYNAAIKESKELVNLLDALSVGWTMIALLKLIRL